jgi:hypothetical protein
MTLSAQLEVKIAVNRQLNESLSLSAPKDFISWHPISSFHCPCFILTLNRVDIANFSTLVTRDVSGLQGKANPG